MHQSNQKQNQQTRSTLLLLELLSNDVLYYSTYIKQPAKPPTLEQKKNRKIEQQKIKQQKIEQKNNIINDILMQLGQLHIHNPSL